MKQFIFNIKRTSYFEITVNAETREEAEELAISVAEEMYNSNALYEIYACDEIDEKERHVIK